MPTFSALPLLLGRNHGRRLDADHGHAHVALLRNSCRGLPERSTPHVLGVWVVANKVYLQERNMRMPLRGIDDDAHSLCMQFIHL